ANLSPLLGLLGTVLGMIKAFARLESAGTKVDPAILAGGIWEALLTTAFGLSVAIPALAAFYILEGQVENVRAQMKDATIRVLGILSSR
ncbi:MAG: MotA/TolQ/ExbB proton channel family protein, partial [Alphaproteobacteria bacterium]